MGMPKDTQTTIHLLEYDVAHLAKTPHAQFLCGVDEAGRGPLAGPVVCASVIMPLHNRIEGINDSKKVPEQKREILFEKIIQVAHAYRIVVVDAATIDSINILQATKKGMAEAITSLHVTPDAIVVDAVKGLDIDKPYTYLIKGDATSYSIAASSILAKVARDRIMREAALMYPQYGFDKHKGYGTAMHIEAIKMHGLTPLHRTTFTKKFVNH